MLWGHTHWTGNRQFFGLINLGNDFEDIGPMRLALGGASIAIGAFCGRWTIHDKRDKARAD